MEATWAQLSSLDDRLKLICYRPFTDALHHNGSPSAQNVASESFSDGRLSATRYPPPNALRNETKSPLNGLIHLRVPLTNTVTSGVDAVGANLMMRRSARDPFIYVVPSPPLGCRRHRRFRRPSMHPRPGGACAVRTNAVHKRRLRTAHRTDR
jgi:hypothetical protein